MATETITVKIDDINNKVREDVESVTFAVGEVRYTIDLGRDNRKAFNDALAPFVAKAAIAKSGKGTRRPIAEIKAWALLQDAEIAGKVKEDKPLPRAVIRAYNAVHGTEY